MSYTIIQGSLGGMKWAIMSDFFRLFKSSHVAQIMRRFRRVCAAVGSSYFILYSIK